MLVNLIENFMQISSENAKALIEILNLENLWHAKPTWKNKEYSLDTANTQADVVAYIQAVGQGVLFTGHDRSKYTNNASNTSLNNLYYDLFERMGLTAECIAPNESPVYSVILGTSEQQVMTRLKYMRQDFLKGIIPTSKTIFGLGCNRLLGEGVIGDEESSKAELRTQDLPLTEINMVTLLTKKILENVEDGFALEYIPINTALAAIDRNNPNCAKTTDTAASLKAEIEKIHSNPVGLPVIYAYSNQPFVHRQQADVQLKMGDDYKVVGIGCEIPREKFLATPNSVSVFLNELARLINQNYTKALNNQLSQFAVPLTTEELTELADLRVKSRERADNCAAAPLLVAQSVFKLDDRISTPAIAPMSTMSPRI
jgi:hypothetical protein